MRRFVSVVAMPALLSTVLAAAPAFGGGRVGVNLNLNIGPPPVVVAEPPELALIPGAGVYFVPGISADIFFFGGAWWAPRGGGWYRARSLDGPWVVVGRRYVPAPVLRVPGDYRVVYRGAPHVPYGQWKRGHGGHGAGMRHGRWGD